MVHLKLCSVIVGSQIQDGLLHLHIAVLYTHTHTRALSHVCSLSRVLSLSFPLYLPSPLGFSPFFCSSSTNIQVLTMLGGVHFH